MFQTMQEDMVTEIQREFKDSRSEEESSSNAGDEFRSSSDCEAAFAFCPRNVVLEWLRI